MARPKQCRQVMSVPQTMGFKPIGRCCRKEPVRLPLDAYEVIRLLDYEGLQQTEAAEVMKVSRPTLTRIYEQARRAVAKALVEGLPILLTGENAEFVLYKENKIELKVMNQKIGIPTANGVLFPHYGKAPQVTIVTVVDGKVESTEVLTAPEHEHGAMPRFMAAHGCTDVLCGGLGAGAVKILNELNIQVHGGAPELPVEQVVAMYLNGSIVYGDSTCHHDGCGGEGHHHDH